MATHLEDLPDELLLRILDLLPNCDVIKVVPCVCLRWSSLSLDCHIWKNRICNVRKQSESAAVKFFSRKPALRSVSFHHSVDEAVLRSLASHCPTITSLGLDFQFLTLDTLRLITRNCDQIRDLCVDSKVLSCPESAREVALMPRLETLTVHGREHLQLSELGAGCARLRHLHLGLCNVHLGDLGAPLLRRLQALSICCDSVSPDIVHCAESLEKLTLKRPSISSRPDSAVAEDLLPLKALTYVAVFNLTDSPQLVSALMQPLLRSLSLSGHILDDVLLELCRRCPLLEDLDLSGCDQISAQGLSCMCRLRRLRRLSLNYCESLGSGTMTHLARCVGLQELFMYDLNMCLMESDVPRLLELRQLHLLVFEAWFVRDVIPWDSFPKAFPHLRTLYLGLWMSLDTSLPESLKAAMPTTRVKWLVSSKVRWYDVSILDDGDDFVTESEPEEADMDVCVYQDPWGIRLKLLTPKKTSLG